MKKCVLILTVLITVVFILSSCQMSHERVIDTLPDYFAYFEYLDPNSFRDYTFYCKYYYKNIESSTFGGNKYFKQVTNSDISEILQFLNEYEMSVDASPEATKVYDFDKSIITAGDFFYIETLEGKKVGETEYGKFEDYDLYYFDLDEQILYYMHNNN